MTDAPELKPCPFCGAAATLTKDSRTEYFGPDANHDGACPINLDFRDYADPAQAVREWNRRADFPLPTPTYTDADLERADRAVRPGWWANWDKDRRLGMPGCRRHEELDVERRIQLDRARRFVEALEEKP